MGTVRWTGGHAWCRLRGPVVTHGASLFRYWDVMPVRGGSRTSPAGTDHTQETGPKRGVTAVRTADADRPPPGDLQHLTPEGREGSRDGTGAGGGKGTARAMPAP